jgi:PKD repeat protein
VAAPVLGTADADDDGDDESVVVEGSSNQAIPFDFGGADPGTYRFRTRVADTDATATAVISVADLPPSAADADLEDGGTYFRGQLLYRATLGARETIQVRRVAENGTPGPLQTRFRSDDEGDLFVETDLLPGGRYVLVDPEGDEIVRFEVVLQQFSRFAFADPRVDPGSPGTTLEVASNRERYRHRLSATRDGAELSLADLRAVVDETVLGSADVDDDGVDEAVVLRGRASQSLAVDFGGRPAGTYRFTTRVADATATATATVVVGTGNPFTEPVPGTGASAPPTDPDGDGLFEDVDGDGTVAFEDAIALAFADTAGLNSQQRAALDFDSDGDVDFDDAITLAFEV